MSPGRMPYRRFLLTLLPAFVLTACGQAGPSKSTQNIPATVEEAAAVLDLTKTDLVPGSEPPQSRAVSGFTYHAAAGVPAAFTFHRDQLTAAGWKEEPGSTASEAVGSGVYTKDGYQLSLTVMPTGQPDKAMVMLQNHGNVRPDSIPLPPDSKLVFASPIVANYSNPASVEAAREAAEAGLKAAGWVPYGAAGDVRWFKKNAVRLSLNVMAAPAADGATMIMVQSELLPADLPVPPEAQGVDYATSLKRLDFTTSTAPEAVMEFYRTSVPGWTTRMNEARQEDANQVLAFRNAQNDLIVLSLTSDSSGGTRATLEFQSAEEIAEMNRRLDAQAEAYKKKQAQESASSEAPQE